MTQQTEIWRVAAASVRGSGHERVGMPCQDAHHWAVGGEGLATSPQPTRPEGTRKGEGVLAVAVADGAGSAPLAEIGSALAARAAADALVDVPVDPALWTVRLRSALEAALSAVEAEAASRGVPSRDLATTLIVVLAGESGVAVAQIGDGAVVIGDSTGSLTSLTVPRSGEYINETTFLISPGAVEQAQHATWSGTPSHIAVFSDGLQRLALKTPENTPHAGFFQPLFKFVESATDPDSATAQLSAFLLSPRVATRADDDLTLVLACRKETD